MSEAGITGDRALLKPCQRYFWRAVPLQQQTGSSVFEALFYPQTHQAGIAGIATLLESPYPLPPDSLPVQATEMARYSICAGAPREVNGQPQLWTPPLGEILPFLQSLTAQAPVQTVISDVEISLPDDIPFVGGWLGWLGYDLAWEVESLPWLKDDELPFPVAFWYEPAEFAVLDHHLQQLWLVSETLEGLQGLVDKVVSLSVESVGALAPNATRSDQEAAFENFPSIYIDKKKSGERKKADIVTVSDLNKRSVDNSDTYDLTFETDQQTFEQAVRRAKAHIRAGDVFQVNHSLRFQAKTRVPSWSVYKTLQGINPSPFASYWHTPWGAVVSCSPERLVHLKAGRAQSRPIAGTRSRGSSVAEDAANAEELRRDRKEQAEHIMLVDLERNDLGRVCEWGSVQVEELMTVERYSHVMHLVSNVVGQLSTEHNRSDLIAALFPGGTITGCPKVRCMEIIETLEPVRRSLFYGSCGYFDRRGRLDLNILIRTLLLAHPIGKASDSDAANISDSDLTTVWGQVGAGIVADSEPEREWLESLQKAKAQLLALGL
ncbi:MAG: chorismate-binding protein [Cyanobacteria bacterium J06649_4]